MMPDLARLTRGSGTNESAVRWLAFAGALVLAVPVALAGRTAAIEPSSIAGAKTGLTKSAYKRLLGRPVVVEYLENDYSRLVFTRRKIEVYFHGKSDSGVVVGTWSRAYRTAKGVGPCSTVAALRAAYGTRLARVLVAGSRAGYRLGRLVFAVDRGRVRAVSLKAPSAPFFVAIATAPRAGGCP
jgi:hypothetical protein